MSGIVFIAEGCSRHSEACTRGLCVTLSIIYPGGEESGGAGRASHRVTGIPTIRGTGWELSLGVANFHFCSPSALPREASTRAHRALEGLRGEPQPLTACLAESPLRLAHVLGLPSTCPSHIFVWRKETPYLLHQGSHSESFTVTLKSCVPGKCVNSYLGA